MHECKCGKSFKSLMGLCGHQAHCGGSKRKKCTVCGKSIIVNSYKKHVESHRNDSECPVCEKPIHGKKYCSSSCSAIANNTGRRRHGKSPSNCMNCGSKTRKHSNKYCSNQCQRDYEWKLFYEEVDRTEMFPTPISNKRAKHYLVEKHGRYCWVCKGTMWMEQPIPLEIDHIDGNSENNKVENLRMVCGNCGMQLPTYKNKNKGNGRYLRRKRYAEGKSY